MLITIDEAALLMRVTPAKLLEAFLAGGIRLRKIGDITWVHTRDFLANDDAREIENAWKNALANTVRRTSFQTVRHDY